ncbi:SH3 domain-containing protein [Agromyces bracchium]|uniref:SH3 domain-containing protein n=1 Tax=Agromyces bracchium TaxID=88376 RepID=A0A6I3M8U5_9MICO|nr:SH3 domain-containing protein [Agromyces bracchium]MTH69401.1 SH3 domain-containing protein [Agromyces bracchium]
MLQRQGAPPVAPVVAFKPAATLTTLTLGELDDYARDRPDWMTDPALSAATRRDLMDLLRWARRGAPAPMDPCRPFTCADLVAQSATDRRDLEVFARASQRKDSAEPPDGTTALADAVKLGGTIRELETRLPKADLHRGLGGTDEAKAELGVLSGSGRAADLASYFRRAHAYLEADTGRDSKSYREWGADPAAYIGKVPDVRNLHRFQEALLKQLITNRADRSRSKPLLIILHTGTDHNGAFHDDAQLTDVVTNAANLALMIEGATTLEAAGARLTALARTYGQAGRVKQVMLAGHGGPTGIELAGRPGAPDSAASDAPGTTSRRRTERFIRGLVAVMAPGPDARIVLNACLTAAEPVADNLPANPALARATILHSLTTNPSIATLIRNMAGGRTVEGNVASVGPGSYITAAGELHQTIPGDEAAASTNPADYVEKGHEPEGAARSLVVLWARDAAAATAAMTARKGHGFTSYGDVVIAEIFDVFESTGDISGLARVAEQSSRGLSEFHDSDHQTPGEIWGMENAAAFESKLAPKIRAIGSIGAGGRVALDQVRLGPDPTRVAAITGIVQAATSLDALRKHLSDEWLATRIVDLLPHASAAAPTRAHIMLGGATWPHAHTEGFFRANAGGGTRLRPPAGESVDRLTDADPSENTILTKLGIVRTAPTPPAAGGGAVAAVESLSKVGRTTPAWLNVREGPDLATARVDVLPRGARIDIIGQSGAWFAVLFGGHMRYVSKRYVVVLP